MLYLIIAQDIKPLLSQGLIVREKFTDHNDAILMKKYSKLTEKNSMRVHP